MCKWNCVPAILAKNQIVVGARMGNECLSGKGGRLLSNSLGNMKTSKVLCVCRFTSCNIT
jgi:hypothetical protein